MANRDSGNGTRWYPSVTTKLRAILLEPQNRPNYIIAVSCGMAPSRLSEYALGKRQIPVHHLIRLCEVLHCNPDDILGEYQMEHEGE